MAFEFVTDRLCATVFRISAPFSGGFSSAITVPPPRARDQATLVVVSCPDSTFSQLRGAEVHSPLCLKCFASCSDRDLACCALLATETMSLLSCFPCA